MSFAGWFNVSRQETWDSRLSFPIVDHKAVKRLEQARARVASVSEKMNNYLYISAL
jgi:hypothetical protein